MPTASRITPPSLQWHTSHRHGHESEWPEALHPNALCVHLNFHGEASLVMPSGKTLELKPQTMTWSRGITIAHRLHSRDHHEATTLVYPDQWIAHILRDIPASLSSAMRRLITETGKIAISPARQLTIHDLAWARSLLTPHISQTARDLIISSRLTDFLLREIFLESKRQPMKTVAISRSERAAYDRIERVKANVLRQLDHEHQLSELAATAGCSPSYLSRTFARITGISLVQWIRRARIDKAAELLATGRRNVSEAALEVGYHSFSHFSRAFLTEKGVPPSKWVSHLHQSKSNSHH